MTTTPDPIINPVPIPPDNRPVVEMQFEGGDATRAFLARCGVTVAREIETLGCTGAHKRGLSIEEIGVLRLGLAGGGVGLPCFVGPDRFCRAHNTIGGLQNEQAQLYPEEVAAISRELTKEEAGKIAFTEAVRHSTKSSDGVGDRIAAASGMLSGYGDMPRGTELIEEDEEMTPVPRSPTLGHPFACPEHTVLVWTCRFCVAGAVANGELEPVFTIHQTDRGAASGVPGSDLAAGLEKLDAAGANEVEIYVLVKTMKRRLA